MPITNISENLTNFNLKTLSNQVSNLYHKPKEKPEESMLLNITDEEIDLICRDVFNTSLSIPGL